MAGSHHFSFLRRAACNTDEQAQSHGAFYGQSAHFRGGQPRASPTPSFEENDLYFQTDYLIIDRIIRNVLKQEFPARLKPRAKLPPHQNQISPLCQQTTSMATAAAVTEASATNKKNRNTTSILMWLCNKSLGQHGKVVVSWLHEGSHTMQ